MLLVGAQALDPLNKSQLSAYVLSWLRKEQELAAAAERDIPGPLQAEQSGEADGKSCRESVGHVVKGDADCFRRIGTEPRIGTSDRRDSSAERFSGIERDPPEFVGVGSPVTEGTSLTTRQSRPDDPANSPGGRCGGKKIADMHWRWRSSSRISYARPKTGSRSWKRSGRGGRGGGMLLMTRATGAISRRTGFAFAHR
jgi:hypothetical protein